jgi:3-oxoacyl-[acyl-carrier protein] reductase
MELKGAVALVTGGNGGLGQRICQALAREGAHVALMYARSRDQAESVAGELTSRYQINAHAFACDITDGAAVHRLVGEVTRTFGRLDVLINGAAYNVSIPFGDLDNLTLEVWDKVMAINLRGPMRLTKAVAPVMKAQGRGRIVNIASVAGLSPTGSSIAYAVSKAGLIHLTRCMAVALAPETLVVCVAPGVQQGSKWRLDVPVSVARAQCLFAAEAAGVPALDALYGGFQGSGRTCGKLPDRAPRRVCWTNCHSPRSGRGDQCMFHPVRCRSGACAAWWRPSRPNPTPERLALTARCTRCRI